jgi:hypothetical protein
LVNELNNLEQEYISYLDFNYPLNPSPWTEKHKLDFVNRATLAFEKLKKELDSDFEIENCVHQCV